ncbi:MAG: glycosyltransferase [Candidatus Sumerlaeia bacterium]|nr:glycosyltransferase [Candidatus Sumerlaeia bacterium]
MNPFFVSHVIIAKDEELVIERHLRSISGAHKYWDEIVVADTGSTDRTRELAASMGARVVEVPWTHSFSEARNAAIAHADPRADLVVMFDADELLGRNGHLLRGRLEADHHAGKRFFGVTLEWSYNPDGSPHYIQPKFAAFDPRMFRFEHHFHELLVGPYTFENQVKYGDIVLEHRPLRNRQGGERKAVWSRAAEREMADFPDDPRSLFYCAREFHYLGDNARAAETYERYFRTSGDSSIYRMQARELHAKVLSALGRHDEAYRQLLLAIEHTPDRREPYMRLAEFCFARKRWIETAVWCRAALAIAPSPELFLHQTHMAHYRDSPHDLLSIALYNLGDKEEGRRQLELAIGYRPGDARLLANRRWFE